MAALLGVEGAEEPRPHFVPAAPVWAAVRRRQSAWGFSDHEMIEHLGLAGVRVIDCREWMTRPFAEALLRRLSTPARATAGTRAALRHMHVAETSLHVVKDVERRRIAEELRGVPPGVAAQAAAS